MLKKLLLGLIIVVPGIAQADWVEVDRDDESVFYMDPARAVFTNKSIGYAETWVKAVIHNDLTKDGLSVGDHRLTKFEFRCNGKELALAAVYEYKNGNVINSYIPSYKAFKPAIPDSRGEFFLDLVCEEE